VSKSYLFFMPTQLPLMTELLSADTVRSFTDAASVQAALSAHLPTLAWDPSPEGALAHGTATDGSMVYEFSIREHAPALLVGLRASGRVDSVPFVQRLCDATGWVAFDDRPRCFQPHHPPIPA
jgi:hypothetical protein